MCEEQRLVYGKKPSLSILIYRQQDAQNTHLCFTPPEEVIYICIIKTIDIAIILARILSVLMVTELAAILKKKQANEHNNFHCTQGFLWL